MERTTTQTEFSDNLLEPQTMVKSNNKRSNNNKKNKNQRRFSDEQIKLLETMFESETRLEPKKKAEVARELGLQPRQVTIWFQNKRARWKSKQIEHDLRSLRADYQCLVSKFESLKQEKQSLITQLQSLNDMLMRKVCDDGGSSSKNTDQEDDFAKPIYSNKNFVHEGLETNNPVDFLNDHHHHRDRDHDHNHNHDDDYDNDNWYKSDMSDQSRAQWLNFWF